MGRPRIAAVSVDLDEVGCYAAIHGLDATALPSDSVYDHALPRFLELFRSCGIPATFFVVGRDLDREQNAAAIRAVRDAGHEVGNHSWHHHYDFSRRGKAHMLAEVQGAQERIARTLGTPASGFRAPGYVVNDALFEVLRELGFRWDSSVFSCPSYYLAKAAAIAVKRLSGRPSRSIVDRPSVLTAPVTPYRVGVPYTARAAAGGHGITELPIAVTPFLRLPYIGTTLALAGKRGSGILTRQMSQRAFVNLELHGIDLADAEQDGLSGLAHVQPDLKVPGFRKRAALEIAIKTLQRRDYRFVTLSEAARLFDRSTQPDD